MVTFVSAFQSIVYVTVISVMALYGRHRNATIQGSDLLPERCIKIYGEKYFNCFTPMTTLAVTSVTSAVTLPPKPGLRCHETSLFLCQRFQRMHKNACNLLLFKERYRCHNCLMCIPSSVIRKLLCQQRITHFILKSPSARAFLALIPWIPSDELL